MDNLMNCNLVSLTEAEVKEVNGGGVPAIVIAGAVIGGAFVAGLAVGALAAWAVYELTR